jgi:tricorn protease
MRFADVHKDRIVFTYEGDLWLVDAAGGDARRITSDPGEEKYAKFSPDGSLLAFTGNYDGGTDVYVMPAGGGVPRRLTWHPEADNVLDWFPDGRAILFRSRRNWPTRADQVYRVPVDGGMETRLPVDRAGLTAVSPDGSRIAYNRISTEFRTWKRYQGGMAPAIWMGSLETGDFQKITDWVGTNSWPMWQGESIYFTSDRQGGTLNLYRYDEGTKQTTALTSYKDYDVKYPSIGPGAIVYQYAEELYLLPLEAGGSPSTPRKVAVNIPTDHVRMRPWYVAAGQNNGVFGLSPSGGRLVLEARGEIVSVPVEKDRGEPVNLTRSSGSREKNPAWSPDGRWIACLSDRTGEEEVWLLDPAGHGEGRQLTRGNRGFRTQLVWSPDSRWLLFSDKYMRLNLVDAAGGNLTVVDQGRFDDGWERWGIQDYAWSPDSRWIAYTKMNENLYETIHLYDLESRKSHAVTDDTFTSWSPSFDPAGRYLYFLSFRSFAPIMGAIDQNHIFLDMACPYVLVLKDGAPSPFAPKDEPEPAPAGEKKKEDQPAESRPAPPMTEVSTLDFRRRIVAVPGVPAGNYFRLEAVDKGFLCLKKDKAEFNKYQVVTDFTGGELDLYHYQVDAEQPADRGPKKLLSGIANYHLSADGKKLVYRAGSDYGVVDAAKEAKVGDGKIELSAVRIKIDRVQEYLQVFNEAWRVQRDWFYDPALHGVDWNATGGMYRRFVPSCGNRSDLVYLVGEMIGELNAGHTYSYGGDDQSQPRQMAVGLLGADFDTPDGAAHHRIAHIVPGDNWNEAETSPLAAPGCPVQEGDYLIAIDGETVKATDNVYAFLEGKAGRVVELTTNDRPSAEGAKTCRVRTVSSEAGLRYREWVEGRKAYVEKATGGKVGYVHLPDMGENGLKEFARYFHPQHTRRAIILDDRYNSGGFTGDMIIDRLERRLWSVTQAREGGLVRNPEGSFHGHYVVVINEDTGSNGEYFAEAIKFKGLARLIGMRTWGGAIGIEPHQLLVDGGTCTPPQFAPIGLRGNWLIEAHGVEPDREVQNMPADVLKGKDAQLDAAIAEVMEKLAAEPMDLPAVPAYPKRAKQAG